MAGISDGHKAVLAFAVIAGGALIWGGVRNSPGGGVKVAARATEDLAGFAARSVPEPFSRPVIGPDQHDGVVVYTPHRYPRACGAEISAVIHHGWQTMFLPHEKDMTWLSRPPGEADL